MGFDTYGMPACSVCPLCPAVDGPAVAREAAKLTKSAVVAQPINFKRTAPGYENATTGFTTCWEGNDWVGIIMLAYY